MAELFHNFFMLALQCAWWKQYMICEKNEVMHIVLNQHGSLPDLLMLHTYVLCMMQVRGIV